MADRQSSQEKQQTPYFLLTYCRVAPPGFEFQPSIGIIIALVKCVAGKEMNNLKINRQESFSPDADMYRIAFDIGSLTSEKVVIIFIHVARNPGIQDTGGGSVHLKKSKHLLKRRSAKKWGG